MEGIVDVYEQYFINLVEPPKLDYFKLNTHTCFICREEIRKDDSSYGKFDKYSTEKNIIEYLEHLKNFDFSKKTAQVFINSIRDSGILCKKVKGYWEFKEDEKYYVFVLEHCLNLEPEKIEVAKIVTSPPLLIREEIVYPQEKVKKDKDEYI